MYLNTSFGFHAFQVVIKVLIQWLSIALIVFKLVLHPLPMEKSNLMECVHFVVVTKVNVN